MIKQEKIMIKSNWKRVVRITTLAVLSLFITAGIHAQQTRTITGTVIDETGESIIGASVTVSGTSIGTATNIDGQFTLQGVPMEATIEVRYLGYVSQQIRAGSGDNRLNITLMEDFQSLQEVIVVGYGTQRRETLSGAVASISAAELTTTRTDNVISNMQGKMPGLLIRQQTGEPGVFNNMVSIRGFGTPVVVIDGVVRTRDGMSDLAQLNTDDIESISILKDASAAIYGMNAANGVIIVTTKQGESGKARFSYSGMYGLKMPTGIEPMMSAYDYRLMANEFNRNIGVGHTYNDETLENFRLGNRGFQNWDWIELYLKERTPNHNHTFSVRGGSDRVRYFTSFSYSEDNGFLVKDISNYDRFTFRNNLTAELTDNLSMNVMLSGRIDNRLWPREEFIWIYKTLIVNDRGTGPYTLHDPSLLSDIGPESKNIEALIDPDIEGYNAEKNHTLQSSVDFTYKAPFLDGLTVNLLGSYDMRNGNRSQLQKSYKLYSYHNTDARPTTFGTDRYWNRIDLYNRAYAKLQVNYTWKYQDHTLALMGAAEASQVRLDNIRGDRPYNDVFTFDILNEASSTGQTNAGSREIRRLAAFLGRVNYDFQGKYILEGMLRRDGSYRYAPKYRWAVFPSVSVAWRASEEGFFQNLFPVINNFKLRASYGESGRDQGDPYQYMAAYTQSSSRGYMFDDGKFTIGYVPPGVVLDNMTWVSAKFYNAAVDIDIMRSKFGGTLEFFQRKNTGILASRQSSVPNTFAALFPQENINSDMNIGLELALRYRDRIGRSYRHSASINVTFARTKRLHVERAPFTSQWARWREGNNSPHRYIGRNLIYVYDGQYTSMEQYETAPLLGGVRGNSLMLPGSYRIIDSNGDGRINSDDQVYNNWAYGEQGYTSGETSNASRRVNPPLQYGFTYDANYKNWDVNLLFQGAALYSINYHMNDIWGYGRYPTLHTKFWDRWHTVNTVENGKIVYADPLDPATQWIAGKYPPGKPYQIQYSTDGNAIDIWRPRADYLRLKTAELGFTLPKSWLNNTGFDNVRFYVNGTNLLTFCREELKYADPERQENEWDAGLAYPIMKSVNFGINLNF